MQSLIVAVVNSDLIPDDEREKIESRVRKGLLGPLSPDRESGPFMLYCCGDDLETISIKTNFPKDVLYVTAIHYDWKKKASMLRSDSKDFNPANIQKDLANSLLIATSIAVKEQLQDVLAGRKSASQCPLIPKNVQALDKLMTMISNLNNPAPAAGPGGTVIQAQNVQVNNQHNNTNSNDSSEIIDVEEDEEYRKERELKYKALRGE